MRAPHRRPVSTMEQFAASVRISDDIGDFSKRDVMPPFNDRTDAGRRLAGELMRYADRKPIVLALPRGGVPVAAEICRALNAPLGLVMVRKIGVPAQPELALGAVVDGNEPEIVVNDEIAMRLGFDDKRISALAETELAEIERRRRRYGEAAQSLPVSRRTVIVVDDGIATGATVRVALKALRKREAAFVILAVPVAPREVIDRLGRDADVVVCLSTPRWFSSVGRAYVDFDQVSDHAVAELLAKFGERDGV